MFLTSNKLNYSTVVTKHPWVYLNVVSKRLTVKHAESVINIKIFMFKIVYIKHKYIYILLTKIVFCAYQFSFNQNIYNIKLYMSLKYPEDSSFMNCFWTPLNCIYKCI